MAESPDQPPPPPSPAPAETAAAPRAHAAFRLPPFSAEDPALWLAQVECACRVAGIADSSVKFDLLVANLPTDVARQVRDVITATPADYTALTSALQARLVQSRAARLSALLRNTQLGDQKPTQLLLRMRSELGEEAQDSALLRTLFLQRLPRAATAALSLLPEDTSLSQLATAAHRYLEATGSHELAAMQLTGSTASATAGDVPTLHSTVASLTAAVQRLEMALGDRSRAASRDRDGGAVSDRYRRRSRSRGRRQQPQQLQQPQQQQQKQLCFFHRRFGAAARKCAEPCSWSPLNETA